jgi:hypothetical protein
MQFCKQFCKQIISIRKQSVCNCKQIIYKDILSNSVLQKAKSTSFTGDRFKEKAKCHNKTNICIPLQSPKTPLPEAVQITENKERIAVGAKNVCKREFAVMTILCSEYS